MSEQNILTPVDATLTVEGAPADAKATGEAINNLQDLIGDTPTSEQISAALHNHEHKNYVSLEEFNNLKDIVMQLCDLVGDTAVSEQISMSFNALNEALLTKL